MIGSNSKLEKFQKNFNRALLSSVRLSSKIIGENQSECENNLGYYVTFINTLNFAVRSFNKGFAVHIAPNSVAAGHSISLPVALWR